MIVKSGKCARFIQIKAVFALLMIANHFLGGIYEKKYLFKDVVADSRVRVSVLP